MNNDLEQFSEERLKDMQKHVAAGMALGYADALLIRRVIDIALAAKQAMPVAYMYRDNLHSDARFSLTSQIGNWSSEEISEYEITEIPLYTTPQPAHTEQDVWIKCSDNLPAETEDADGGATGYLVRYEKDRVPNGGFNIGVSNCVFLRTHWRGLYTHWMPLPTAPKPESE